MTRTHEMTTKKALRKLAFYDFFSEHTDSSSVRLVHYVGANAPNAKDVPLSEVCEEVENCIDEGFYVDWCRRSGQLTILVQEPDGPIPPWDKVFAEQPLVDVDALLREARARGELDSD